MDITMCSRVTIDKLWSQLTESEKTEVKQYWGMGYKYAPVPTKYL